ncbi:putative methionyl-tRNA synthetase [Hordeum vulgare]|nr:putative methionyl-tRNA synthetase [Hordeum vulgare]
MDHGEKAMSNYWAAIQQACNEWHGIQEEVMARPVTNANFERRMVRMFRMLRRDNNDQDFKFLHMFTRIESCEK